MTTTMIEKHFCSSPWFHMQVLNDGTMDYCRWNFDQPPVAGNLATHEPLHYFAQDLAPVRQTLLTGEMPAGCASCQRMEQHGKVSGRQKQLLKTGIQTSNFVPTAINSEWNRVFVNSAHSGGVTTQLPQDWQVHLGNHCNSACLFCLPEASSRLAAQHHALKLIDTLPNANWSESPENLDRLVKALLNSPVRYLHFIGGETLITPAFRYILQRLIDQHCADQITVGFTTNLTVWDQDTIELLEYFKQVHVGCSIECLDSVNDYVRWPSKIQSVLTTLEKWRVTCNMWNWYMQLRTTPTALTVANVLSVYDYAWQHRIPVESCNFLENPEFMRPTVLPMTMREQIVHQMQEWCQDRPHSNQQVVNTRHPSHVRDQLVQDLASYCDYLTKAPDESHRLPELAQYLQRMDNLRGNSVSKYLPHLDDLFRATER